MSFHLPRADTPRRQLGVIALKCLLVLVLVALVTASIVQQRSQTELKKTQRQLAAVQVEANLAHNDNACAMRVLTKTLVARTRAALARPTTLEKDKPGYRVAIAVYSALHDAQVTVPVKLDCRLILTNP